MSHGYGKQLKNMRVTQGLTQGQVAKIFGYTSPQFISNWERGLAHVPDESVKILSLIYGVTLKDLSKMILDDYSKAFYKKIKDQKIDPKILKRLN